MSSNSQLKSLILKDNGYYVFLTAFLLYMCVGIFPLYCYESDSMHTIMGISTLYNQGFVAPPIYSYAYDMQPLAYYLAAGIRHILPFLTCEQIYCGLTGLAALSLVPLTVYIVNRLTSLHKNIILLALFLIPETMAIGMYPNTAILALVPAMLGFLCILDHKYVLSAIALVIAPLFRIDVLMIYPVVLFFFMYQGETFVTGLKKSLLLGICVTVFMVAGFAIMSANPLDSTLKGYEKWNVEISLKSIVYAIILFYTLANFVLVPIGIYLIAKRKNYVLLLLALTPIILNHFVYRSMACATKHFLYMLPFVVVLTSFSIAWIKKIVAQRKCAKYALLFMLALYIFGSTRIDVDSKPWRSDVDVAEARIGPVWHLFNTNVGPVKAEIGIGAGEAIITADELMLLSGNGVYPLYIHNLKTRALRRREQAVNFIGNKSCILTANTWENQASLPLCFVDNGFKLKKKKSDLILTKGNQSILVNRQRETVQHGDDASACDNCLLESINMAKKTGKPSYMFNSTGSTIYLCNRQVAKGNIELVSGTESLYFINPNK